MAITIDWGTRVITIPKADMTLVQSSPFEIRELDLDAFRLVLKNLEDSEEGIPCPDTHRHNTTVVLGGVTLARVIEIINGYTVTFEDGNYAVNATGANSNIADVLNLNQVSLRTFNSAGLQVVIQGSGLSAEEHNKLMAAAIEDDGRIEAIQDNLGEVDGKVDDLAIVAADIPAIKAETDGISALDDKVEAIGLNILDILSDMGFIKDIEGGKWEIDGDEMVFYKADNTTEIARFTIARDVNNNPIMRTRLP